jgi:transposase
METFLQSCPKKSALNPLPLAERVQVITSVQWRRRWSAEEKARMVQELFSWRRLYAEGALSAVSAGEEVVPASDYRVLHQQVRELQRLLGKKALENQILREALDLVQPKKRLRRASSADRDGTP